MQTNIKLTAALLSLAFAAGNPAHASSHREAPFLTHSPKVDGTDFYMFRSYGSESDSTVTFIANYLPLQDAYGGPNYFDLDTEAVYEIHIDNDGDAVEDITFQFDFNDVINDLKVPAGGEMVSVPLKNIGAIGPLANGTDNVTSRQTYTVTRINGVRRSGNSSSVTNSSDGSATFMKPLDNIGNKSISDYAAYAADHVYSITIPGCTDTGKVFVGQRREGFAVNLGEIFDLVNTNPVGPRDGETNTIANKNVTSLALQLPISCVTQGTEPVIGAWTTASLRQARILNPSPTADAFTGGNNGKKASVQGGAFTQVSRLGMPLVNEVVIGLKDKDRFNASHPSADGQFATYVTNPALPELLEILFGVTAPNKFPRTDLVSVFLTGVTGLNQPASVTASEMLRLNTSTPVTATASQDSLGVLAGDNAGFPNGRRPGDDVVDIALRAAMGVLLGNDPDAGDNTLPYTDGAIVSASDFDESFPYLKTPIAGSPAN
ncbi:hypothetical protein FHR99_002553 [Litorivivens lipolytica]|uniref:DUF4331 domain-containing protein n=1 Tax=Litorivivens lipolytica TaxID=1524264 RepID=A0A7W4W6D4_9GAMM|nr:DUF4331 domain-containing protein [Litorivivens lipolytica]MBB3048279.1 hypothetical protein [Litorivivens lipolytica]